MSFPSRICRKCLCKLPRTTGNLTPRYSRAYSTATSQDSSGSDTESASHSVPEQPHHATASTPPEKGPMSRRLEEATEEALLTGGRAGRRAVEDAGFSQELKTRLLTKIATAQFQPDNTGAVDTVGLSSAVQTLPSSAGRGTRDIATAQPWTGEEPASDTVLRMLNDAHKPLAPALRGKPRLPAPAAAVVDMRLRREPAVSAGRRVAAAREKAAVYTGLDVKGLSEEERAAVRRELRERFEPGSRAMPSTLSGLAALANERIEDAIARGQFRDIPRGKGVERDARADNPFIDTTEYIMNKMIKRQDMVPPWIEKQQELARAAHAFRARMRSDWRRHAARAIASRGGSLGEQMAQAEAFARAEERCNPRRRDVEQISVPGASTDDPVMVGMRKGTRDAAAAASSSSSSGEGGSGGPAETSEVREAPSLKDEPMSTHPFRDSAWEAAERSYMELAVKNLNATTRSYNLMAPDLAKKPYFSLQRELDSCFADVAPTLAETIKERAARPPPPPGSPLGGGPLGVLDQLGGGGEGRVHDSKTPNYGFKEMWRDLFAREGKV